MTQWSVVYKKAIQDDGTLLFPERLTKEFLDNARLTMGTKLFNNQYQNIIISDEDRIFKDTWLRYNKETPSNVYNFGFIDPAIGQKKHSDFTGITIISASSDGKWYSQLLVRERLTPTQIVDRMFELCNQFQLKYLGVEIVAFQEALLYMLSEEMNRRQKTLPVKGISRSLISKNSRILSLVPRFEWGRIFIPQGMKDFEDEYTAFPRGSHDDILDSLASLEEFVFYPIPEKDKPIERPHSASDPNHERWVIQNYGKNQGTNDGTEYDND